MSEYISLNFYEAGKLPTIMMNQNQIQAPPTVNIKASKSGDSRLYTFFIADIIKNGAVMIAIRDNIANGKNSSVILTLPYQVPL